MGDLIPVDRTNQVSLEDQFGILDCDGLERRASHVEPHLVEVLIPEHQVGILVGHSGIGKTPAAIAAGVSVAAGLPFLGHATKRGRVLYCAGEGNISQIARMARTLSDTAGLAKPPPELLVWGPYWDRGHGEAVGLDAIFKRIRAIRPAFVIVDTLRIFVPNIESKAFDATTTVKLMRQVSADVGCSWLLVHHRNKPSEDRPSDLLTDPYRWFDDTAGTNALITQTDARLGLDTYRRTTPRADLILGGFVRGRGTIPTHYIAREYGEDNEPRGYQVLAGRNRLDAGEQAVFDALPEQFTRTQLQERIGGQSDSNVARYIDEFKAAGLITQPVKRGPFLKVCGVPGDER